MTAQPTDPPTSQDLCEAQASPAGGGPDTAAAIHASTPSAPALLRVVPPATDHMLSDAHTGLVGGGGPTSPDQASRSSTPMGDTPGQGSTPAVEAIDVAPTRGVPPRLLDPTLAMAAAVVDDLERARTANGNRYGTLTRTGADKDGEIRGFGLDDDHPDVATLRAIIDGLTKVEEQAVRNLERAVRRHPLGPWVAAQKGVGAKQAGRLLAAVGDPYWNTLHDRPRTVSELWAYCGLHNVPASQSGSDVHGTSAGGGETGSSHPDQSRTDAQLPLVWVAARRQKGQKANWSSDAKTRAQLIAESCTKQLAKPCYRPEDSPYAVHVDGCTCSPWRVVYDLRRAETITRVHATECMNRSRVTPNGCGTREHPEWGAVGSPWRPGHQHRDGIRVTAKEILESLWRAARDLHTGGL